MSHQKESSHLQLKTQNDRKSHGSNGLNNNSHDGVVEQHGPTENMEKKSNGDTSRNTTSNKTARPINEVSSSTPDARFDHKEKQAHVPEDETNDILNEGKSPHRNFDGIDLHDNDELVEWKVKECDNVSSRESTPIMDLTHNSRDSENGEPTPRQSILSSYSAHSGDGDDIFARGLVFLEAKAKKISELENQKEEEMAKTLTFKPEISKRAQELNALRTGPYYNYSEQWREKVNSSLEQKKQQLEKEELNKIVEKKKGLSKKSKYIIEKNLKQNKYRNPIDGWEERFAQYQKHRVEQSKVNSEFKPQINKKSVNLRRKGSVYNRLHGEAQEKEKKMLSKREQLRMRELYDPQTGQELFKPKINHNTSLNRPSLESNVLRDLQGWNQLSPHVHSKNNHRYSLESQSITNNSKKPIVSRHSNEMSPNVDKLNQSPVLHWSRFSEAEREHLSQSPPSGRNYISKSQFNPNHTQAELDAAAQIDQFLERRKLQEQIKQRKLRLLQEKKYSEVSRLFHDSDAIATDVYTNANERRDLRLTKINFLKGFLGQNVGFSNITSSNSNLSDKEIGERYLREYLNFDMDTESYDGTVDSNHNMWSSDLESESSNILPDEQFHFDNESVSSPKFSIRNHETGNINSNLDEYIDEFVDRSVKNAWRSVQEKQHSMETKPSSIPVSPSEVDEPILRQLNPYTRDATDHVIDKIHNDLENALSDWDSLLELSIRK